MKVPAARQLNIISVIGEPPPTAQPIMTPIGVKIANKKRRNRTWLSRSGKAFAIEVPKDIPAAPLCMTIASVNIATLSIYFPMPTAIPSNRE